MSRDQENQEIVRALFENASRGDFDAIDEVVAPDYALHPAGVRGADGLKQMIEGYRHAIYGLRVTIDQQFSDGDYVATRFTIRGTHEGELMDTPATGSNVAFTGITISRCANGRVVEEWEIIDAVGLLGQISAQAAMAPR